ncbi:MAG: helix-turn-helix domain-containing protein [Acidimicrobiales bacterium]
MGRVRVEFTVEPFLDGRLGPHVEAALGALRSAGHTPDVGPFGSAVEGDAAPLLAAVSGAMTASFEAGASGISLTARAVAEPGAVDAEAFLAAVQPVARALGGRVVEGGRMSPGAVPLVWRGQVVGGLERPEPGDLRNGLAALVAQIESELGSPLAGLDRVDKQRAVRLLDERGAFAIRNAVDEVADAMGVSRVTVYNYLNATRSVG